MATCAGLSVLSVAHGAAAQSTPSSPAAQNAVDTVIVTARRKSENIQSVPISITALSQADLKADNITTIADLQYRVTSLNVSMGNTGRDFPIVSIRGINGQATDGQGVITYVNEVALPPGPQNETGGGIGLLYDLENVQVLKGPQGTLFGRNAIGGAVLYQTKRPTSNLEGYLEGTLGNHRDREFDGALNLPLVEDRLMVRLAANAADRHGFTKSLGTPDHPSGLDLDNRKYWAARATVTARPTDTVRNDLIFNIVDNRNNGPSAILADVSPTSLGATFFPGLLTAVAQQRALGIRTQLATNVPNYTKSKFTSLTDILSVNLTDNLVFRNIASAQRVWGTFAGDTDGTAMPVLALSVGGGGPDDTPYILKSYSEEAQLQGTSFGGRLSWTAGGLYESRPAQPEYNFKFEVLGSLILTGPSATKSTSKGLYLQGTYDLSDWVKNLNVTAGFRESWDSLEVLAPGTPHSSFKAPTWNVSVDYHVSDDTMVYATARRGYHSGGINVLGGAASLAYLPEYVTDVELGAKSDQQIAGIKSRTTVAVYRANYTNFQSSQPLAIPGTSPPVLVVTIGNDGAARIWGAELEERLLLTERLEVEAQFDYLDFAYTKFAPGADINKAEQTILANGARYKYGVGARYEVPVAEGLGDVSVSAHWSWQSRTTFRFGPSLQPAYGLLSLNAEWNHVMGRPVGLSFFMTNALNKVYRVNSFDFTRGSLGFLGTRTDVYGEPRMFGVRLHYDFGG